MSFLNTSNDMILGTIISQGSSSVAGNMFITMFIIFIFLLAMCILLGIPLEFTALLLFPFVLTVATYESNFLPLLIVFLFYFTFIFVKRFIFR